MSYFHFYWANFKSSKAFLKSTLTYKALLNNLLQWRTVLTIWWILTPRLISHSHPLQPSSYRTDVSMLMYFGDQKLLNKVRPNQDVIGVQQVSLEKLKETLNEYIGLRAQSYARDLQSMSFQDKQQYRESYRHSPHELAKQLGKDAKKAGKASLLECSNLIPVWEYLDGLNTHLFGMYVGESISSDLSFYDEYVKTFSKLVLPYLDLPNDILSSTVSMYGLQIIAEEVKAEDFLMRVVAARRQQKFAPSNHHSQTHQ